MALPGKEKKKKQPRGFSATPQEIWAFRSRAAKHLPETNGGKWGRKTDVQWWRRSKGKKNKNTSGVCDVLH